MTRPRRLIQAVAKRLLGERAVPVGGLARDRHLLGQAFDGRRRERVLVVGPGLAVRQTLAHADVDVDVVGTSPYRSEVTICSALTGTGSLPPARWDTVVVTAVEDDFDRQLGALVTGCRPGGRIAIFQRTETTEQPEYINQLKSVAELERVLTTRGRALWIARVST